MADERLCFLTQPDFVTFPKFMKEQFGVKFWLFEQFLEKSRNSRWRMGNTSDVIVMSYDVIVPFLQMSKKTALDILYAYWV